MGTTPNGYPYPEPTDPVAQGATAIRSLAEKVDVNLALGVLAGQGQVTTDANGRGTYTFPRPFLTAPLIQVTWRGTGASVVCTIYSKTPTSVIIAFNKTSDGTPNASVTLNFDYIAVGNFA